MSVGLSVCPRDVIQSVRYSKTFDFFEVFSSSQQVFPHNSPCPPDRDYRLSPQCRCSMKLRQQRDNLQGCFKDVLNDGLRGSCTKGGFLVTNNRVFNGLFGHLLRSFAHTAHSAHPLPSAPLRYCRFPHLLHSRACSLTLLTLSWDS